jgi:DNA helicase-2/ATP-dependent DNA helicase PcrA
VTLNSAPAASATLDAGVPGVTLNDAQRMAVAHREGPCLVIAGPGSGKTRVIVERLVDLHSDGVALDEILVLTYTVAATEEMLQRALRALPPEAAPRLMNFHTFSRQLISAHGHRVGIARQWRQISDPEKWLIARDILRAWQPAGLYSPQDPWGLVRPLLAVVEDAKQELITPETYGVWAQEQLTHLDESADPMHVDVLQRHEVVAEFYARMESRTRADRLLDYDDQIVLAERLLRENPTAVTAMTGGVRYVMVDEYQDTNFAQARLVEALVAAHRNLMVIADDDQSIYKFRGASLANLERFERLFAPHPTIPLTVNYRSTPEIVAATSSVIGKSTGARREKDLVSARQPGRAVRLWRSSTELSEATAVARECRRLVTEDEVPLREIAWLFKQHADMTIPMRALEAEAIPYHVQGGKGYWETPELQALLALLKAIDDISDTQSVIRTLRLPLWSVSIAGRQALIDAARRSDVPLVEQLLAGGVTGALGLEDGDFAAARQAADVLRDLSVASRTTDAVNLIVDAFDASGYLGIPELTRQIELGQAVANVQKFQGLLDSFMEFSRRDNRLHAALDYLDAVRLSGTADTLGEIEGRVDAVRLMTAHASKGLEFEAVFVTQCRRFRWPGDRRAADLFSIPDELVEEPAPAGDVHVDEARRLMYVAMTRARNHLVLGCADRYGRSFSDEVVSPFVSDAITVGRLAMERQPHIDPEVTLPRPIVSATVARQVEPSVYDLIAFKACPRQYQYQAQYKVPTKQEPNRWFGTLMHKVLERAGRRRLAGEVVDGDALVAMWEEEWVGAPRAYRRGDHPELLEHGASMLRAYARTPQWNDVEIQDVERSFVIAGARVHGRLDRVDRGVELPVIVDYKTGPPPSDPSRLKKDVQVRAYAVRLAEETGAAEGIEVQMHYLQDRSVVSVKFDAGFLQTARRQIEATANEIREAVLENHFPMKPDEWTCGHCAYATICPKGSAPKARQGVRQLGA